MYTIDMLALRDQFFAKAQLAYEGLSNTSLLEVGSLVLFLGVLAGAVELHRIYLRGKGYRMALKVRNLKKKEILSRVINDGLFEAECNGEISNQEVLGLYRELSEKLDLPDLVPQKRRAKLVKVQIKGRLHADNSIYKHKPSIPGAPEPLAKPKLRQTLGNFASKFWRTA
jgi:hypothetical protein